MKKDEDSISSAAVTFGSNLRKLRKEHNLTQEKLAEALNITPKHLGELEAGRSFTSAAMLDEIVNYFGVGYNELFLSAEQSKTIETEAARMASEMLRNASEEFDRQYGITLHLADDD